MAQSAPLVAISHRSIYRYGREVTLGPHVVKLRPSPRSRTPTRDYQLTVYPEPLFAAWGVDESGNHMARLVIGEKTRSLEVKVDLTAELLPYNPFEFVVDHSAVEFPFEYETPLREELHGSLLVKESGPRLLEFLDSLDRGPRNSVEFLVELNRRVSEKVEYTERHDPGVHSCEELLTAGHGSCRDSSWLLIQLLRHCGLAARFVSGYLVQLKTDESEPVPEADRIAEDSVDLHAWAEVFLPGAGWIGLDPTSGLLTGAGHIPLASAAVPEAAAPLRGSVEQADVEVSFTLSLQRLDRGLVTEPLR